MEKIKKLCLEFAERLITEREADEERRKEREDDEE